MAQYQVEHTCGHLQNHVLFGKHSGYGGRDEKQEWLATTLCTDCYRAEKEKEKQAQNERAAEMAKINGLPALVGSQKQITWANTIRQKIYEEIAAKSRKPKTSAALVSLELYAGWWIDNRQEGWYGIALKLATAHPAENAKIQEDAKSEEKITVSPYAGMTNEEIHAAKERNQ